MPSWTFREFVVALRSKTQGQNGSRNPALAGFASRFIKTFGPMQDPLVVSEVLGKLGRRAVDPAARRRAIAARIAILSLGGREPLRQTEIISEAPEPATVQAPVTPPVAPPKDREPAVKKPTKTKIVKTIVALEDTSVLLVAISLSDKVKRVTDLPGREDSATHLTIDDLTNITDGFAMTYASAKPTGTSAAVEMPFVDQLSGAQSLSSDDISHATKQITSKVLNLAPESALPPGVSALSSENNSSQTDEGPADAKVPKKKIRGKQMISFDLSALDDLGQDSPEEIQAPQSPAGATGAVVSDGTSDQPYPLRDITPKRI
jgi:hypothetical protein